VLLALALAACVAEPQQETSGRAAALRPDHVWPPQVGQPYPDLKLIGLDGERVSLASLRGKVILIEPIGMDCPACNAFAGGNRPGVGGFEGTRPQKGLRDTAQMLEQYARVSASDARLVHVQLLLYDMKRSGAPTLELARRWSEHFGFGDAPNEYVLVGEPYLIGRASYGMIPGYQLVDRDFVLRYDATGHRPRHDLWRELLPAVGGLLEEVRASDA
jgi:hypothetical protein